VHPRAHPDSAVAVRRARGAISAIRIDPTDAASNPPEMVRTVLTVSLLSSLLFGCASRYEAFGLPSQPAAKADIVVRVNRTDNREVKMRVEHLAPPRKIDVSYSVYAVWFAVPGHGVVKAGVLDYDNDDRRGDLVATSPHNKFEVLISLEKDASVDAPSDAIVLRQVVAAM
jgi:hypothetical protein